jgi:hypothetical protein
MFNESPVHEFLGGSKRVDVHEITKAMSSLNKAFFMLEQDPEALKKADMENHFDPEKAQDLVYEAMHQLENLTDVPFSKLDDLLYDLKHATENIKSMKISVDVEQEKSGGFF